jgi:hypothetical protein
MATHRVLNPKGDVVDTKDIESADDGHWAFFDDSEGDRKIVTPRR